MSHYVRSSHMLTFLVICAKFSCSWWPWKFWGLQVRSFVWCFSTKICLISCLEWGCFGKEDNSGEVLFLSYPIRDTHIPQTWLTTVDVTCWGCVVKFLTLRSSFTAPPLHIIFFGRKRPCTAHTLKMQTSVLPFWRQSI